MEEEKKVEETTKVEQEENRKKTHILTPEEIFADEKNIGVSKDGEVYGYFEFV